MLLLGTSNVNKVLEFSRLLKEISLCGLSEVGCDIEVDESGATYAENAALKASLYARKTGRWVLSDDTGLGVEALGGAPGILSARFAGPNATGPENVHKLLENLRGVEDRQATFHCALALANANGEVVLTSSGMLEGRILKEPVGEGGFTYDYVFFEEKSGCTLAEMPSFAVDRLSHRAKAVKAIKKELRRLLKDE